MSKNSISGEKQNKLSFIQNLMLNTNFYFIIFFLYNIVMVYVSLFAYLMLILRGRQNLFLNKAAYHFIKNDF